jgi:4-amino-4-deoxy-L-arabinose transferase-like glycosyltransferase
MRGAEQDADVIRARVDPVHADPDSASGARVSGAAPAATGHHGRTGAGAVAAPEPGNTIPSRDADRRGVQRGVKRTGREVPSPASGATEVAPSGRSMLIAACLVCALVGTMLFARLGAVPLVNPDEGRNAQVASEMQRTGSWLIPTYNGATYLDKPAFFFRAAALCMSALGETETAARLPSALSALALAGLVFAFVRWRVGMRAAVIAVAVLVTTPIFVGFARIVIFDMMLTLCVVAAILCGFVAEERTARARTRWYLLSAASMGVATLVKGPVGFLLPLVVLATFHVVERRFDALRRLFSARNGLVFLAVVLPWFVGVSRLHPDFPHYGIVEESLRRFGTESFKRSRPFWFFLPVIVAGCMPWSALFPAAAVAAWRERASLTRTDRFLLVWVVAVTVFFSLSQSKLPGYILPAVVALAMLVARVLDAAVTRPEGITALWVRRSIAAVACTSLVVAGVLALESARPDTFAIPVGARPLLDDLLHPPWLAAVLGVCGLVLAALPWRGSVRTALVATVLFLPCVCAVGFTAAVRTFESHSTRVLARAIAARAPGIDVACLQSYPDGLGFYLQSTFPLFTRDGGELKSNYVLSVFGKQGPLPANMIPLSGVEGWLDARDRPVLLVGDQHQHDLLARLSLARGAEPVVLADEWSGALIQPAGAR